MLLCYFSFQRAVCGEGVGRNSSISCGVSVPQAAATCMPEGEPQRAGPGRQMRGRENETERASGRRGTEKYRDGGRANELETLRA